MLKLSRVVPIVLVLFACSLAWLAPAESAVLAPPFESRGQTIGVIEGTVTTSGVPLVSAVVNLYSSRAEAGGRVIATSTTDENGFFIILYREPEDVESVLSLVTKGGKPATTQQEVSRYFSLATVLGPSPYAETVVINELTTVASAFSVAQFMTDSRISGENPGLRIASRILRNLVDIETGGLGATIQNEANGPPSLTLNILNDLGNLLATCARDEGVCQELLRTALPLHGRAPKETFQALANVAATPWNDPAPIFNLIDSAYYQPDLGSTPPSAWTLALKFEGSPRALAGPGNIAVDENGQLWVCNNYVHEKGFVLPDCAGDLLYRMDPATGLVDTFSGGGLDGAGYGVSVAPNGDIWVGNFGFKGDTCPRTPASDSVSQFSPTGEAISPDAQGPNSGGGWTNGGIGWPQGTVVNSKGDVWIANCNGQIIDDRQVDLTIYRGGNPDDWFTVSEPELRKPFDVAFDSGKNAWVSGTNSDNIYAFKADGSLIDGAPFDLGEGSKPMGVASDSQGNVWVTLSGILELPCPDRISPIAGSHRPGAVMLNVNGIQAKTRSVHGADIPGGLTIAWGISVDGADNVWVANFEKGGVSHFCGSTPDVSCPRGYTTGDALSPDETGYGSALLDRNTAVTVDASGNVWLCNNWKNKPIQTNPSGDGLVVFIGVATPIAPPLIGTPKKQCDLPICPL